MEDTSKHFPNIPVTHWHNLRIQFKKSIPGTISSNYLASVLDMTEASAKVNITPSLRQIGLIDTKGKTNQDLARKLRDDSLYPKFCEEVIKKIYPQELRDAFPDKDSSRDQIKTWFMNHTGVGDSAGSRIVAFYIALLQADPKVTTASNNTSKTKDAKPKSASIQIKKAVKTEKKQAPEVKTQPVSHHEKHNFGPDLNINIQIHISSDASPDQIKSIFENMAKYVYKNQINE